MALAVDASTPDAATSTTGGTVSATITNCPANALIVAGSVHNTTSGTTTDDATMSGGSLTWTQEVKVGEFTAGFNAGLCQVSWARNGGSIQNITATVTGTNVRGEVALKLVVLTGALAAGDPLTTATGHSDNTNNLSVPIVTTVDQSICLGFMSDWWASTTYTAPTGFTTLPTNGAGIVNGNIGYWFVRKDGNVTPSGTTVTFTCSNAAATARNNFIAVEVLPAATTATAIPGVTRRPINWGNLWSAIR